jgi:hypothetical protein
LGSGADPVCGRFNARPLGPKKLTRLQLKISNLRHLGQALLPLSIEVEVYCPFLGREIGCDDHRRDRKQAEE